MEIYKGKGISFGVAFGTAKIIKKTKHHIDNTTAENADAEWRDFLKAKEKTANELDALYEKTLEQFGEDEALIIDVQRVMLLDEDYDDYVRLKIFDEKKTAAYATTKAGNHFSEYFSSLDDPYMNARAVDIEDVSNRLTGVLLGVSNGLHLVEPAIIIAEDLFPGETLQMDKSKIKAIVIQKGSKVSHTAILARSMGIPCVIQCDISLDDSLDGENVAVDGEAGLCYVRLDDKTREMLLNKKNKEKLEKDELSEMKGKKTITSDGREIKLYANIGSSEDIPSVLENDSEGIGLYRTEFLYLGRTDYPSEEEQFVAYRKVVETMDGKEVVIRTIDIGADKQAEYFKLDAEENPALGLRGIRICIERPDVFKTQLRAICRASAFGNVSMMFPMIASLWELRHCKNMVTEVCEELISEGCTVGKIGIGIMIETPAAVMIADDLAKEADFFSVGTNDLTSYTLAIDRQNESLERFYDPYHPSLMKMLEMVATVARNNGISICICGELAADTEVTEFLIDRGFDKLSISPTNTLALRKHIMGISKT